MQAELLISREALRANINFFKSKSTSSFLCPMVKANAYGVGDSLVVGELLQIGVRHFGVARVSEGERLRRLFPQKEFDILVFAPICASKIESYIASTLTPIIGSETDLRLLGELSQSDLSLLGGVHVKFDMGMTRLGFDFSEASIVCENLQSLNVKVLGICGHFSQAASVGDKNSKDHKELEKLTKLAELFKIKTDMVHAPNSEALNAGSFNVGSRPGISLYGLSDDLKLANNLEPVLTLQAPLVHTRKVKAGTRVSYGGVWESKKDTTVGVLLIGYADGLPRGMSGNMKLGSSEGEFQQVGRICMDYTMVDLGLKSSLKIGQKLTFFGKDHEPKALTEWANSLGCISYELLVGLGDRLLRRVI